MKRTALRKDLPEPRSMQDFLSLQFLRQGYELSQPGFPSHGKIQIGTDHLSPYRYQPAYGGKCYSKPAGLVLFPNPFRVKAASPSAKKILCYICFSRCYCPG